MKLADLYVRFFRSFNFDFIRQDAAGVDEYPWDRLEGDETTFYPFVKIKIEADVTTVVGANEAGKTQLIGAIERLLGEVAINTRDFCRYSEFFGVTGTLPLPEFGGRFTGLDEEQQELVGDLTGAAGDLDEIWFFRLRQGAFLYAGPGVEKSSASIDETQISKLRFPLPRIIKSNVELPSSVNLYDLRDDHQGPESYSRSDWMAFLRASRDTFAKNQEESVTLASLMGPPVTSSEGDKERARASLGIMRDLLETLTEVDHDLYELLLESTDQDDGHSAALTTRLTQAVGVALNFPKWWSQDRTFSLRLSKDGFHLLVTLVDKTGQSYTFDERSGGMKFFLSYLIQRLAYKPVEETRSEILLMDEPDAYLSNQGQQDLLRVLVDYAYPDGRRADGIQVLYVTHSPFLIDKNHPERIRVLQKTVGDEGTRVVTKAATDEFEPLRSAFSTFHAQTAFIGTCNLLVEGVADMILYSGLSSVIRSHELPYAALDLNYLTMVPVHGAAQYRYMIHLTRGRSADRPAVIVLLDSDKAGDRAGVDLANLEKGFGADDLIDKKLILAIDELDKDQLDLDVKAVHEPEDLVPADVARAAVIHFASKFLTASDELARIDENLPNPLKPGNSRIYDTARTALIEATAWRSRPLELNKTDFAQSVVEVARTSAIEGVDRALSNFAVLFERLNDLQSSALVEHNHAMTSEAVRRRVQRFKTQHRVIASKQSVDRLLRDVEDRVQGVTAADAAAREAIRTIRHDFDLDANPLDAVDDLKELKRRLRSLQV